MLRGAIIGFGAVAIHGHLPAYAQCDEAEIIAVVDRDEARRKIAREAIPGIATFATVADLIAAKIEIDFVDICTPPALHAKLIHEALAQQWNVLCEKPLVLDIAELEEIREAIRTSGKAVIPVHNWKYAPIILRATHLLRSNAIGQLRGVEIETLRFEDCAAVDAANPGWRRDPQMAGGGILFDHGWHAIYLASHWFQDTPTNLAATLHRTALAGVEDEATVTLNFPGGTAHIFLTWRAPHRRNRMRLIGDLGAISIDDDKLTVGDELISLEPALSAGSHHPDWFAAMLPDVIAAFRDPKSSGEALEEAAVCLSMIRRAYQIADLI